ncbi:L-lactate dehydrogenase [Caulobacter mirabilis]|uniref:Alpha-hydroxy-acid oxidizing enzyme n=1 Tax=Caulobacter mirabilis TaxID=69666 RepID=A0A2D2B169_9CAUL|nr:L-lactate dehydrogenase [Caulobacter mirabilis]ATQ44014.1 alpha-hydroxy-acid oxidizing enzyme [Caulobacter mirabilis]
MIPASVSDYRELARRRLPRLLFDYIDGGSYAEATLRRNVEDFEDLALRQRVLRDVSEIALETELFGQPLSMPVMLAPVGMAGMYARRGEVQAARAAKAAGVPFCLSTVSVCDLGEVTTAVGTPPWFQLYMIRDRGYMGELLARAKGLGSPVLVFTVDLPVPGARYRDMRTGLFGGKPSLSAAMRRAWDGISHPDWLLDVQIGGKPHTFGNLAAAIPEAKGMAEFWPWVARNFDPRLTWKDLDWIRARWDGPIVIKGVLDSDDAREAVRVGAQGIVVSNHGGRQLDGVLSGVRALPPIVDAVGDDLTVLMDGGVRSGLDVVKALALGAKACLVGRPWAWALGARGEAGVAHVLQILRQEMQMAMALTGCTDVRQAGRDLLVG